MAKIRLWLRTDKIDKIGLAPIHLIYQLHGQRKYYNTGIKLRIESWDAEEQEAVYIDKKQSKKSLPNIDFDTLPTAKDIQNANAHLDSLKMEFSEQEADFERKKITYTADMISTSFKQQKQPLTKKDIKTSIIDFIEQYSIDCTDVKRHRSILVYKTTAKHLKDFETSQKVKITFETIDVSLLKQFRNFLIEKKRLNNTTVAKQLSTLKTLINYARVEYKIKVNQDYRDFKVSRKDANHEVITLTNDEFDRILSLDLSNNKRLERVRDIFIFSCTTGLRFSDLNDLKHEHIRNGTIKKTAIKTNQALHIPLNGISEMILDKYAKEIKPLPIISSQKLNDYIKEVGQLAAIDIPIEKIREFGSQTKSQIFKKYELMSIHMGRRTFATLSLEKGISTQDVMAMTGHTTYSSFKRYVNVTNERKHAVMAKAWGETKSILKLVK